MANNIKLLNMTATEMFRQQLAAATEGIRIYGQDVNAEYIPQQMGGIFAQRDLLEGGNVLRITQIGEGSASNG